MIKLFSTIVFLFGCSTTKHPTNKVPKSIEKMLRTDFTTQAQDMVKYLQNKKKSYADLTNTNKKQKIKHLDIRFQLATKSTKKLTEDIPKYNPKQKLLVKGLYNPHNNCFMNSILQVLLHNKSLVAFMLQDISEIIKNLDLQQISFFHQNLLVLTHRFFKKYHNEKNISLKQEAEAYLNIFRNLPNIDFTGCKQGDSNEFLNLFINNLTEALKVKRNYIIEQKPINESWDTQKESFYLDKSTSPSLLHNLFSFHFNSRLEKQGKECNKTQLYENLHKLELELSENPIVEEFEKINLSERISHFQKKEDLKDIECSDNNKNLKVDAQKWIEISQYPKYPIFSFKIFNALNEKITIEKLEYSLKIKLGKYEYQLYGVTSHSGGTGGGHYISWIKDELGNWFHISDSNVDNKVSSSNVQNDTEAYLLFYERIEN
jgi:ubiquitin C-terminal hydrolase